MAPFPFRDALGAREHFPRSLPIQFPVFPLTTGCRLDDSCLSQEYSVSGGHQGPPWLQNITSADSLLQGSSRVNRPSASPSLRPHHGVTFADVQGPVSLFRAILFSLARFPVWPQISPPKLYERVQLGQRGNRYCLKNVVIPLGGAWDNVSVL